MTIQDVLLLQPLFNVQTTDATPVSIATIEISDYEGGILEISVLGMEDTGAGAVTAKKIVRYFKDTSLTIGTPADILPLETDLVGATFSISNVSENIDISVTGVAATIVNWTVEAKLILRDNAMSAL